MQAAFDRLGLLDDESPVLCPGDEHVSWLEPESFAKPRRHNQPALRAQLYFCLRGGRWHDMPPMALKNKRATVPQYVPNR
jgi:hypothetical protein